MKVGCVIQGDIRRCTGLIVKELIPKFDFVVLSTWQDEAENLPNGNYCLILSDKPMVLGLSNRNLQRLSTAKGINAARAAGCDYVLKWRTDMLPTKMDISLLHQWAKFNIPNGAKSRLVMPAYRNLSVDPDWFSSIPDLFSFGHISEMEMLWGDSGFNYSLDMNIPNEMAIEIEGYISQSRLLGDIYCAESELYAIFKSRLQNKLSVQLSHSEIAKNYLRLIDYRRLGIYWFGRERGFRSIHQAWEHPWWTEEIWRNGGNIQLELPGYQLSGISSNLRKIASPFLSRADQFHQSLMWAFKKYY